MHRSIAAAVPAGRVRADISLLVTIGLAVFLIYWLPQIDGLLPADVTWIYRLQTMSAASLPPVPEGLRLFSGAPMGWAQACAAHFEAFRRLNCGDIVLWRTTAILAGSHLGIWLGLSTAVNLAALLLMERVLWLLRMPWQLRLAMVAGLALAPGEIWTSVVTSEPRASLAFAAAAALALVRRPVWSALAMVIMVFVKEPSFVWWPLVAAFSMTAAHLTDGTKAMDRRPAIDWWALLPHVVAATIVSTAMVLVWLLIPARNDYPFMLAIPYPAISEFLVTAAEALQPPFLRGSAIWALPAALVLLMTGIVGSKRWGQLKGEVWTPSFWLPVAACVAGIVLHLAVHWLTRRMVGDGRYAVPANIGVLLLVALALRPLLRTAPLWSRVAALAISLLIVLTAFPWADGTIVALGTTTALIGLVLAIVHICLRGSVTLRTGAAAITTGALVGFLSTPFVDARLVEGADQVADSGSWHGTVDSLAKDLPPSAYVVLRTDDALMIETAWSLQAGLLMAGRGDIDLTLQPRDISFFEKENGLVREATDAFNRGHPNPDDAASSGRPRFALLLDRKGRSRSKPRPALAAREWLALSLTSPTEFFRTRYVAGRTGYLDAVLEPLS